MKKTDIQTLISAMRILARDIQSGDGIANAAIAEAAETLEEQHEKIALLMTGKLDSDNECDRLRGERDKLNADIAELQSSFDLNWKASQRAIKLWQEKTGEVLTWPDSANLISWLLLERKNWRDCAKGLNSFAQKARHESFECCLLDGDGKELPCKCGLSDALSTFAAFTKGAK